MKRERISMKWKIFGYLLCFTLLLLVVLWLFQIVYLDSFYRAIKTRDAKKALAEVEEILTGSSEEDSEKIEKKIRELAESKDISVLVTDQDGKTLYCGDYMGGSHLEAMSMEERNTCYRIAKEQEGSAKINMERGKDQGIREEGGQNEGNISGQELPQLPKGEGFKEGMGGEAQSVLYVQLAEAQGEEAVIFLNTLLTPVDATVRTLQIQMLWITAILVVLSLLLAVVISRRVSGSIIRVNDSARELAKGNYTVTFNGKDYKEIAELSDTLNYAAQELDKTEGFRRELLANVSHDLRTPLTMIIAYSEGMRDLPGENTPENIQVVIDESRRLTNLVNDMLDLSKLQAGVLEKEEVRFNLTKSIESVLGRYHKLKEQEGYRIVFEYDSEAEVEADEFKISQVIYNLVNNALNYTGEDKCVTVRQIIQESVVRIEVEDSGDGIPKEDLSYVWDRYYKVDKTHKRAVSGTGLGLSIVKNILELHGAEYGVESEPQQGSVFWFSLKRI